MNTDTAKRLSRRAPDLGEIRIPRVTNLRTASRRAPDLSPVTQATRAWLGLGEALIESLAPVVELDRAWEIPELLDGAVTTVCHLRPAGRIFCGPAYTTWAAETELPWAAQLAPPVGARLAWWSPEGGRAALLIDRLHHTHRAGLVLDEWMRQQVAADLAHGRATAGDEFDGVRVIAHMAYASCVHVLPDFTHHLLGQCPGCLVEPWGGA